MFVLKINKNDYEKIVLIKNNLLFLVTLRQRSRKNILTITLIFINNFFGWRTPALI